MLQVTENGLRFMRFLLVFIAAVLVNSALASDKQTLSLRIKPATLMPMLSASDLLVLDVRNAEQYADGHIPGAVNLPVNKTFRQSGRTDRVAGPVYIQQLLGNAGVDRSKHVVVYDDGRFIDAGRMFWVLEVYGHQGVQLLDGGFSAWEALGLAISTETSLPEAKAFFAVAQPDKLVTKLSMRLATKNNDVTIIDARSAKEFSGKKSISNRFGHIPQAINIPWDANLTEDTNTPFIREITELQELYAGLDRSKKIVTYCNKGKQSSFSYFILREMGYDVAHYDGSWFEWSMDSNLPIVGP